jgi:uncharacterized membrane-anchored protein
MKLAGARRVHEVSLPGVIGVARLDRRAPRLLNRLRAGDIAIIDISDLDRSTADALVAVKVAAVVNAQPSISGRYPNLGPQMLISQGVPLLDAVGAEVFSRVDEGTRVRLDGGALYIGEEQIAHGSRQDTKSIAQAMENAKSGLATQLEAFAASTQQHMQCERALLLDGVGLPELKTTFAGRHVLLVAKGYDFQADLKALKHYIREFHPVLIGIDAGADVLKDAGYRPDLVVGELDSMSEAALQQATEVVAHADPGGRAAGLSRVQDLRVEPLIFSTSGTSEDAAMLLADIGKPPLIVTVGMRATLEEFLDAGRGDMASTVLTRMKVGGRLVDAKAAASLFQTRVSAGALALLAAAALLAITVVLVASTPGESYLHILTDWWSNFIAWVGGIFS